jgi:hypothetical protein
MNPQNTALGIRGLDAEGFPVVLGGREYTITPQRIGWIKHHLGEAFKRLADMELSSENFVNTLGDRAHAVLKVFIPDLMPEWEFLGYPTKEALEAGDYNPEYDKSPSPREVRRAFQVAAQINEFDLLKHLGKLIGPDTIRAYLAERMADSMTSASASSSVTSGDTHSTSSGTEALTSVETTEG